MNSPRNKVFLTIFEVFGNVVKHCLISYQTKLIILRKEWSNKVLKIYANEDQIRYPNTFMLAFV